MDAYRSDWADTCRAILERPGRVLVLGGPDTGKTTFCTYLANLGFRSGLRVGVIDTDIGQSHIGPPATIGLGVVGKEIASLDEAELVSLYFVGSSSPALVLGSMIQGTRHMVGEVRRKGLSLLLVDSTGLIAGRAGHRLKSSKIDTVAPQHIVAIQRGDELESLLSLPGVGKSLIHRLAASKGIRPKSKARRRAFKREGFRQYFKRASVVSLELAGLTVLPRNPGPGWTDLLNLILGLSGERGEVKVGVLQGADSEGRNLLILTPPDEPRRVVSLTIGSMKVKVEAINSSSR